MGLKGIPATFEDPEGNILRNKIPAPLPLAWRVDEGQSRKYRWMNLDERATRKVGSPSDSGQCQEQGMKRTEYRVIGKTPWKVSADQWIL